MVPKHGILVVHRLGDWVPKRGWLSAPTSQRFLICNCDAHCGPQKSLAISKRSPSNAALRFKGAIENRWRFAISSCDFRPKTDSFCGNSGDLTLSTRKSLAIAIVRFWCARGGGPSTIMKASGTVVQSIGAIQLRTLKEMKNG